MDFRQLFDINSFKDLWLPVIIGIVIMVVLFFLRWYLNKLIHKLAAKTTTSFDDILIHEIRIATFLWCIWIGIFSAYTLAETPQDWVKPEANIIPVLFVAIGIYTVITIIMAIFKWYKDEICPRTVSNLDDIIMWILIISTPVVGCALGIIAILNLLGIKSEVVNTWLFVNLAPLAALTIITIILIMLTIFIVPKVVNDVVRKSKAEQSEDEMKKRADTLVSVIGTTFQVFIIVIFVMIVVIQLVSWEAIIPVLTATGVVGVALGFGAQSLVKDILAGVFIILENQYRKGDVVNIAGASGVVEEINLRRTLLRDLDGVSHVVPNGEIRVASNYTKEVSRVNLDISVSYDTDLDKAMIIINKVGKELGEDPVWRSLIIIPPQALRVNKFGDSGIDIKIVGEVKPSQQWSVAGELRLRLKKAFDKEGIEIPWPHTKVYFGNQPPQIGHIEGKG
jgi:moderate conductance mechanosensitive channel